MYNASTTRLHAHLLRAFGAILLAVLLCAPEARAQTQTAVGAQIGYNLDIESALIGADAVISLSSLPVAINPAFNYYFTEVGTFMQFGVNALYPFALDSPTITPYAGAGLGLYYSSVSFTNPFSGETTSASNTDFVVNVIGGASYAMDTIEPFAQARLSLGSGTALSIAGGVRIDI